MGLLAAGCLLAGCAGTSLDGFWGDLCGAPPMYGYRSVPVEETPAFPRTCLTGDPLVADASQCFAGGVHCYQLDTGAWCAGPYSPFVLKPVYHAGFYDWSK
ncbi:hypothetical protein SAMN05216212_0705 [Microbulbifer yueqingensis]|uniref:Uncharacterized protein n=2 Tax=Microbulbifer yueqingensis TaxID=658219 RepID=A0A1G8VRX3_9GAMM|nr:hypothetical protein SAMN05216212_0705 [Microbulbifer yueqingensis]